MKSPKKTRDIRESNIKTILLEIRKQKRIVKSNLARSLQLSFATVSSMCSILEERNFVSAEETQRSTGGRRPVEIQFNPKARYTLAIHIRHDLNTHIALLDLSHDVVDEAGITIKGTPAIELLIDSIDSRFKQLLGKNRIDADNVIGAGVAIPGILNRESGTIQATTSQLLANVNLQERLESRLGKGVFIENDANMAAQAQSISLHRKISNLLFMYFSEGIGLGIIIGGSIYSGASGFAGEIGHTRWLVSSTSEGELEGMALKNIASVTSLLSQYYEGSHSGEQIREQTQLCIDGFLEACRSGEQKALSHLRKTGQIIGFVVAALVDLFNPEMVTLGGNIAPFLDLLLPIIREKVREASFTAQTMDLWINSASDDEALIFRGCGEVAFQEWIKRASIVDMA